MTAEHFRKLYRPGAGAFFVMECPQCGGHQEKRASDNSPIPLVVKKFISDGWRVKNTKAGTQPLKCPSCARHRGQSSNNTMEVIDRMTEQKQPPTNVNRVRFRAGNIIMDNWSDEAGRYKQGWSDDRVSKETGLSEAAIKRMREDDLGLKQRVPPEVESLEARLSTMFESLTDMENELHKIRQKYEAA